MTDNCNIIRDLIPLVIDAAASEDSTKCVETHLETCEACRECYQAMQSAFAVVKAKEEEQKIFSEAARKLRKKRRLRLLRNILIGMLIGCVLAWGGLYGYSYLTQQYNQIVYHGFYGVTLSQLQDGRVSLNLDYYDSHEISGVNFEETVEDGKHILYVYLEKPIITQYVQTPMKNYSCSCLSPERMSELQEIRQGTHKEYVTLWKQGDTVPAASEEMELFFSYSDAYRALWDNSPSTSDGKLMASEEVCREMDILHEKMNAVTVPEWQ